LDRLHVCPAVPALRYWYDKRVIFKRGFGENTGLGLFLARESLAITGITITETGEPGIGAWFEIVVPKGGYRTNRDPDYRQEREM